MLEEGSEGEIFMKEYYKMIKRWDFIIVFFLILLSFLPIFIFQGVQREREMESSINVAVISVNNKEIKRIALDEPSEPLIFDVEDGDGGVNTIEVRDGKIRIKAANCTDQVCVRTGFIQKQGETIVCLPHKVIIEILSMDGSQYGDIISS